MALRGRRSSPRHSLKSARFGRAGKKLPQGVGPSKKLPPTATGLRVLSHGNPTKGRAETMRFATGKAMLVPSPVKRSGSTQGAPVSEPARRSSVVLSSRSNGPRSAALPSRSRRALLVRERAPAPAQGARSVPCPFRAHSLQFRDLPCQPGVARPSISSHGDLRGAPL
jgi:hypothetical protein